MANATSNEEPPAWFLWWLAEGKEKPKEPDVVKLESEIDNLEISESVKIKIKSEMLMQAQQEEQKQKEKDVFNALRKKEDISLLEEPATPMPWSLICKDEVKIIQKLNATLTTKEFGRYSIKTWAIEFSDIFYKNFITDRIGKLSVIYTSTSKPIREQYAEYQTKHRSKSVPNA